MVSLVLITGSGLILLLAILTITSRMRAKQFAKRCRELEVSLSTSQQSFQSLEEEVQTLHHQLRHTIEDPVTHVLGRQLFEDRMNQTIKESERFQFHMGVLFVDVDDFNVVNQAFGHDIGDLVLNEIAKRLELSVRKVDSVSRFNKDTFVILLTQLAKPETAAIVAQRILQSLGQVFEINEHAIYLTVSIGIALFPSDGQDVQTLLRNANHAMRIAKAKSHHSYQFYQEEMHLNSQREMMLLTDINNETSSKEFVLYYQPIFNVENNSVLSMDATLHWMHPTLGLITSDELFGLADKQHRLSFVSEWMIRTACKQFMEWRTTDFRPSMIGVPLSIKQLENSHFIYRISQILQEIGFNPEWLLLEIKENGHQLSYDVMEKAFNMLEYLKINIAIDHFGSNPFSFWHLKQFPIRYLKLDKGLIGDIQDDKKALTLVKSISALAKNLQMDFIVQGVASKEQALLLKASGCVLLQGPFFGSPLLRQEVLQKMAVPVSLS